MGFVEKVVMVSSTYDTYFDYRLRASQKADEAS